MLKFYKENIVLQFVVKAIMLYIAWFLIYELWLHPQGIIDRLMIDNLISGSAKILKLMGYTLIPFPPESETIRTIGIDGTHGLWIGDPCNGLTIFALFTGFIVSFPGKIKDKLWFIPLGLISIHILNIIRIVALCILLRYDATSLEFNHTYTFTLIVYSYVFLLWIIWINKFSIKEYGKRNERK